MVQKQYFLGVDIGGTKSHALVADENGQAVGFGHYGAGNYEGVGWDGLRRALHAVTEQALTHAGISREQLAGAGYGIAGYDWPAERKPHLEAIDALGMNIPYALVNDTIIGLVAGAAQGWGIGVVSGTGCNCWGRDRHGREGHVTGEGWTFAEWGGGGDLVGRAVQAVSLAWSQRGPETKLTEALLGITGAPDATALLEGLTLGRYTLGAGSAPLVFQVAAAGDEVAQDTIRWAGCGLGSMAVGVARQLSLEDEWFEVVLIGSLFKGSPLLEEAMMAELHQVAPQAVTVRLTSPPVAGAVLLGMEQVGLRTPPIRETLIETTQHVLPPA
ncbi:MAG: BadF/BadG/BcrA/BcrD ATPase family protein [Anaerolineae bacterium]|nr:BadF/BadG/BcrA/BcrD ATPase family protein [Anaerolineae bacterium]